MRRGGCVGFDRDGGVGLWGFGLGILRCGCLGRRDFISYIYTPGDVSCL